jgi:serine/threonine-protein phosphatase 2A regulatory subunit B
VASSETSLVARCRRVYAHAHDYHINSISNNSDGETFISADDLRVNLWNLEICDQSFNIVDVKPANMEDLTEVITSAEFHPTHCNTLAYSSSKGTIRLIDMRQSALCDNHAKLFEEQEAPGSRSFFTEIIASISDIKFGKDGRHILSRDYMTLKLWDINMESRPVATFKVHEYLRPKLCDLYENDSIFDKFECCLSGDGLRVATGSYSNLFRVFGCVPASEEATTLEASKTPNRRRNIQANSKTSRSITSLARVRNRRGNESPGSEMNGGGYDFSTKLLHLAWHPTANVIACAASNSLYMYYA